MKLCLCVWEHAATLATCINLQFTSIVDQVIFTLNIFRRSKVRNIACMCILHLNFALAYQIKYFRCENFPINGNFCLLPKVTFLLSYGVWEQGYRKSRN